MTDEQSGRDRLRELLDAVLDDDNRSLDDMAGDAYSSPYHFNRQLSRSAGEPPVAMKRRVLLERAAWQLRQGASVTETAFQAGYESVEGFSRAFTRSYGHPPSAMRDGAAGNAHWLPAPNGIHFHPPFSLWIEDATNQSGTSGAVTTLMLRHDVDDTRMLLEATKQVSEERYREVRLPGWQVTVFENPEESLVRLLERLVFTKEVWVASITGADWPDRSEDDLVSLVRRHEEAAAAWLSVVRDIDRRNAWADRVVDALCDPPESFVLGGVVAHVLTHSAARRALVRRLLREDGIWAGESLESPALTGDPLNWMKRTDS